MYGIGVDLTYIPEFKQALEDKATFFFQKYYTEDEREYANSYSSISLPNYYSSRYAAKEAFIKAIDGNRLFQEKEIDINYKEIETKKDSYGRPFLNFYGRLKTYMLQRKVRQVHVSLSHIKDYSIAQVLIEY